MAETRFVPAGEPIALGHVEPGTLFQYNGGIALKSEYRNRIGEPECYIVGSGEMFWGGVTTGLNSLVVQPLAMQPCS